MDRQTRKANLKKLQLPSTAGNKPKRKTRQTARCTATTNTAISNYFVTPEKHNHVAEINKLSSVDSERNKLREHVPQSHDINLKSDTHAKRIKLDAFIFQDPSNIPDHLKNGRKSLNDEDFFVPEKKSKKAPKLTIGGIQSKSSKSSKAKKQTTIKSAFLRNEQLFAEIAAQHCAADQFDGDDVQLALAISKSEAESKGIRIANDIVIEDEVNLVDGDNKTDSIREKLKNYGFKTAERKDYNDFAAAFLPKINNRRLKSKWGNKFTALTLRSNENQLKKLQENIEKLMNSQFRTKSLSEQERFIPNFKLQSSLLKNSGVHGNRRIFQTAENVNQPIELFFVTDLFEINKLPAGHLLKDWSTIQGRDSTPNPKNKKNAEKKLKMLENIYQELEEYFSSHKRLDWSMKSDNKHEEKVLSNKELATNKEYRHKGESPAVVTSNLNSSKIEKKEENVELNKKEDLREGLQIIKDADNVNNNTNPSDSDCHKQILQLLPTSKYLDIMQVSSCSTNTQSTINNTQKNRSISPDLFADSDVEMEETDKIDEPNSEVETVINVAKDKKSSNFFDEEGGNITTYEIFSSDEVKNTTLLVVNNSAKELSRRNKNSSQSSDDKIIDLTQDDLKLSANNKSNNDFSHSKSIVEIDLFADSPPQAEDHDTGDINSNSQLSKYLQENQKETFKFTLSPQTKDNEQQIVEKKTEETFKLSPNLGTQKQLKQFSSNEENQDIVLRELAMDESNISFLNFQGSKQLQTSFHKKTASADKDITENVLKGNDTIFRELCNKYLNSKPTNTSVADKLQKTDFEESYAKMIPTIQTPQTCDNLTNFTMDFDMTVDNIITLKRKSMSFTAKSPLKLTTQDTNGVLSKSQSFNNNKSNVSIDLTQSDDNDNDNADLAVEEDDDCLILSDDEINYSIWQANKTIKFQTSEQLDHEDKTDNDSASNEEHLVSWKEHIIEFPNQQDNNKKFSYLDLKDTEKSLIKIDLGAEESVSDFEILTSKYATPISPDKHITKSNRSEFGILEEYSEPIDFTSNFFTPTKILTEASFLSSPTETTAPMKRYSNCQGSSQKFKDLINTIETKSPPNALIGNFNDFDEFDNLIATRSLISPKPNNKPQGFEQLLTADISFKESQKTPETKTNCLAASTQEVKCNNKIYTVRDTFSPKPDYTKYTEAELLKELYNFGIKPLKRKQAVKMLEYLYNQTHPILLEEEHEQQLDDVIELDDFERPCTSKEAVKARTISKTIKSTSDTPPTHNGKEVAVNIVENKNQKLGLQDSCGLEILRYGIDLKADLLDEIYILQTNVTKKTPQPLLPLHIAWYNLICSNPKLHETILMYEPIDLQEIYLFLKTIGYRYDPKDLKTFFDRRCIIFRYDIASAAGSNGRTKATNRHVRKSKKTKTTKY